MNHHVTLSARWKLFGFLVLLFIVFILFGLLLKLPQGNKQTRGKKQMLAQQEAPDVLPTRTRILSESSPESIEASIDNLASFTDWALATSIGMDSCPFTGCYGRARLAFPRLNRVRKLLAQIDDSRKPSYKAIFLRKIDESMEGYLESRKEVMADYDRVQSGAIISISEPRAYDRKRATAGASVYILSEWDCHEALPTFARLLEQPDPIPVNRLFLLYSCYLLIETLSTDKFSAEKLAKLKEYKQLAGKCFPPVSRVRVPAWNAKYDETDFRAVILRQRIPVESEASIRLRIYPDISDLEDPNTFQLEQEADILQRVMLSCLRMR